MTGAAPIGTVTPLFIALVVTFLLSVAMLVFVVLAPRREPLDAPATGGTRDVPGDALATEAGPASSGPAWPRMIDESAVELSLDERLKLIKSLGVIGDVWCVEVLETALREERSEPRIAEAVTAALRDSHTA